MYAIVEIAGKQFKVEKDQKLYVHRLKEDEGKIVFQDEHGTKHSFLPNVGDIFIFDGDIRHTAIPTPNSNKERIVYAGSYCVDIYNQKNYGKTLV
mgnify:CR=1 FL=1